MLPQTKANLIIVVQANLEILTLAYPKMLVLNHSVLTQFWNTSFLLNSNSDIKSNCKFESVTNPPTAIVRTVIWLFYYH